MKLAADQKHERLRLDWFTGLLLVSCWFAVQLSVSGSVGLRRRLQRSPERVAAGVHLVQQLLLPQAVELLQDLALLLLSGLLRLLVAPQLLLMLHLGLQVCLVGDCNLPAAAQTEGRNNKPSGLYRLNPWRLFVVTMVTVLLRLR